MTEENRISLLKYKNARRDAGSRPWNRVIFSKPKEVGCFSLDEKRKFSCDRSLEKMVVNTSLHDADLNDGYKDRFIKRDEGIREGLDFILRWILNERKTNEKFKLPRFVLWRGHMTRVMCTPYESRDGWQMAVQKKGHTFYISEIEMEEAKTKRQKRTDKDKLMMYWGVRFEGYMTKTIASDHDDEPKQKQVKLETVTNTNEAYCGVLRSSVNQHSILFSGEVDCCDQSKKPPPDNYIELKTSRVLTSKKQNDNFHRYKTVKWWAQSFLAGVPSIWCGFRDDNGIVKHVKKFETLSLPNLARNIPHTWNPNVCLDFLNYFFTEVERICRDENDVYIFTWNVGQDHITYKKVNLPEGLHVLPSWYT